jgi:hypothetical protein
MNLKTRKQKHFSLQSRCRDRQLLTKLVHFNENKDDMSCTTEKRGEQSTNSLHKSCVSKSKSFS